MTYVCEERGVPMMKIQSAALLTLQTASEDYLTNLFSKSQLTSIHGKRITVTPKDVQLVRCFSSGESFYKHLKNTTGTSTD
jgi:histone H3/H4